MLTVTVGTTDYTFDWIAQHIHIEALVTEVTAADLKLAIHDAQDDVIGMSFLPIADFYNPVTLTPTTDTFLNVVLRDQWRIESYSTSGTLVVGSGNVVNVNNGIDIFVPNPLVSMVNNTSQAGVLVTGGGIGTPAEVSDAVWGDTSTYTDAEKGKILADIFKRLALDTSNPVTHSDTNISSADSDVDIDITDNLDGTFTESRQ